MLKKINNLSLVDDKGREMKIHFRGEYISYKEGEYATYIGIHYEKFLEAPLIIIDAASDFNDWLFPPHKGEHITIRKKLEILNFLEEGLTALGYKYQVNNRPFDKSHWINKS